MTRYLIHIGPHKTGTTYLQTCFQRCRDELQRKGIFYSVGWQGNRGPGHADLAARLKVGDPKLVDEFAEVNAAGHGVVLISAEDLSTFSTESIRFFQECAGGHPANIVYYARRQADLLFSAWQESIKHGNVGTLPAFLAEHFIAPFRSSIMNPSLILDRWTEVFGFKSVSVAGYDTIQAENLDLFRHFAKSFLDWHDASTPDLPRINPSLTPVEAELWRVINVVRTLGSEQNPRLLPRQFAKVKQSPGLVPVFEAMQGSQDVLRIDDHSALLRDLVRKVLTKYAPAIVEPRIPNLLYPRKVTQLVSIRQDYLLRPEVLSSIRSVAEAIGREES